MKVSGAIFSNATSTRLMLYCLGVAAMLSATPCEVMLLHGSSSYATSAEVADITSCGVALLFLEVARSKYLNECYSLWSNATSLE